MKIISEFLATIIKTSYLCNVKCMFDYPGRIPRGSKTLSTLLHFKELLSIEQLFYFYLIKRRIKVRKKFVSSKLLRVIDNCFFPLNINTSQALWLDSK